MYQTAFLQKKKTKREKTRWDSQFSPCAEWVFPSRNFLSELPDWVNSLRRSRYSSPKTRHRRMNPDRRRLQQLLG